MNGQQTSAAVGLFLHEFYMSISRVPAVVLPQADLVHCPHGSELKLPLRRRGFPFVLAGQAVTSWEPLAEIN